MKRVVTSRKKINPFGGINFVIHALKKRGMASLINNTLGKRPKQAKYSYSDVILFWVFCNLCGGERLEDSKHFKQYFTGTPGLKMPSPDAIGRVFKSMAVANTEIQTNSSQKHLFNNHDLLDNLLLKTINKLSVVDRNKSHTLDYDNTVIKTDKYDAKFSYEKIYGYQPGVSFINKVPIHVQGRNGDAVAQLDISSTIRRSIELAEAYGISINRFRSDSAAYQVNIVKLMEEKNIDFFIRTRNHQNLELEIANIHKWENHFINGETLSMASIEYEVFRNTYRCVVTRREYQGGDYKYWTIITNNKVMSSREIFDFYNQRGKIEKNFDTLKNDFNWQRLPFSFMHENTVFMILSALANVIYLYSVDRFSEKVSFVRKNFRLKNFICFFITVGAEWLNDSELKLHTANRYEVLLE